MAVANTGRRSTRIVGTRLVVAAIATASALAGGLVATPSPARAATTIHVPGDYTTIQAAIDAAANGDSVVVASGTSSN